MGLEIYDFNPVHFLSAPVLVWQATLKNIKVKLDILTDIDGKKIINCRRRYQRWNMSCYLLICES